MMPASTKAGGQCLGFPDVCKTPAPPAPFVPVPYPNMAMPNQGNPGTMTKKVKIGNMAAVQKGTEIPMSSGDEAGSIGGMVSSMIKGPVKYKRASGKVKFEGKAAGYVTCMTAHNGSNANMPAGAQLAPSQTKVLVAM
jgi:hypothetical protein